MRHKSDPHSVISVVVAVSDLEERTALRNILQFSNWRIHVVDGPEAAAAFLGTKGVGVVVVSYRTAGAYRWCDLISDTRRMTPSPAIVVTDRIGGESMWAEVLNYGAYDMLPQPFEPREVFYLLAAAWRFWRETSNTPQTAEARTCAA